MSDFKITAQMGGDLSEFERMRINMAYNFYVEGLKESGAWLYVALESVVKADKLLEALGYELDDPITVPGKEDV